MTDFQFSTSFGSASDAVPKGGEYEYFTEYADKKKELLEKNRGSLEKLSQLSPSSFLSDGVTDSLTNAIWDRVKDGPLEQLGQDYIAEMIAKNGRIIMNNLATKLMPMDAIKGRILTPLQDANQMVFDAITMAATAQNEVMMLFIQQTARMARDAIQKKRAILVELQEKVRQLNNALAIVVAGDPFFSEYCTRLRQALVLLWDASNDLRVTYNTLSVKNTFLDRRYQQAIDTMIKARDYLEPQATKDPDVKITDGGILENVGVVSKPQQLTMLLAIPKLTQEVLASARGYFQATIKANAMLLSFQLSYGSLEKTMSTTVVNYAKNRINQTREVLDSTIDDMCLKLNGATGELNPIPGFKPDSIKTSTSALGWTMELNVVIEMAKITPTSALKSLDSSNSAVQKYQACVEKLKTFNTRRSGQAVLIATEAREQYGQLESQLATFCLKSLMAMADAKTSQEIKSLGRTIYARLGLSIEQDTEIEAVLNTFINANLGFTSEVTKLKNSIQKTLKMFGLDRAADKLNSGAFGEFFGMNAKTATYAGAAMVGIQTLMSCTSTTEQRSILEKASRMIQADQNKQKILLQRTVSRSYAQQDREIELQQKNITSLEKKASQAAKAAKADSKCSIPDDMNPLNNFDNVFAALGVNVFGSSTITSKMKTLGKGII